MKKWMLGGVVITAATVTIAGTATAMRAGSRHRPGSTTASTSPSTSRSVSTTSTTAAPAPTTTTATLPPKPVDPLAGVAVLRLDWRRIVAVDAQGHDLRTLVTAYEGRMVMQAQMMSDHHTIWYLTAPDYRLTTPTTYQCDDVVRLDLATNTRTVIAHASQFSASANGERVVLVDVQPDSSCTGGWTTGATVVRDVATGAESNIVGSSYGYVLSPDGRTLAGTLCTEDTEGCHIALRTGAVPATLGASVTMQPVNDPKLSFLSLAPRSDGLYAIVDKQPQSCGCGGRSDRYDSDISVRRFAWSDLGGAGTSVYTLTGPRYFEAIVPTVGGLYATGSEKVSAPNALYRITAGAATQVRALAADAGYVPVAGIPPFAG